MTFDCIFKCIQARPNSQIWAGFLFLSAKVSLLDQIDFVSAFAHKETIGWFYPCNRLGWMKREHGADDPNRGQCHGCPRNCKRIASSISPLVPPGKAKRCSNREPGDLPTADIHNRPG